MEYYPQFNPPTDCCYDYCVRSFKKVTYWEMFPSDCVKKNQKNCPVQPAAPRLEHLMPLSSNLLNHLNCSLHTVTITAYWKLFVKKMKGIVGKTVHIIQCKQKFLSSMLHYCCLMSLCCMFKQVANNFVYFCCMHTMHMQCAMSQFLSPSALDRVKINICSCTILQNINILSNVPKGIQ